MTLLNLHACKLLHGNSNRSGTVLLTAYDDVVHGEQIKIHE
jgi:hypothetical protein